jgi:hypothetical protein
VLTAEGQRMRDEFERNLVTDAGPLAPLRESDLPSDSAPRQARSACR